MAYILGFDASQFQGTNIDFNQVKASGRAFGITRMTYAYPGQSVRIDPTAGKNYAGMVSAGIVPGGYHKVGWTDPIVEADAFINAMSPLAEGDLLMHDIEPASDVAIPANWAEWEQVYVQRIFDRCHTYSLRYLNISMTNSMPAQGIVTNCAPFVAAPSYSFDAALPVNVTVMFQQGPAIHMPGITANVTDTDAFFGTLDELKKYGYHLPTQAPSPQPTQEQPANGITQPTAPIQEPPATPVTPTEAPVEEPAKPQNNDTGAAPGDSASIVTGSTAATPVTPAIASPPPRRRPLLQLLMDWLRRLLRWI